MTEKSAFVVTGEFRRAVYRSAETLGDLGKTIGMHRSHMSAYLREGRRFGKGVAERFEKLGAFVGVAPATKFVGARRVKRPAK
jgi:hypothetical protein